MAKAGKWVFTLLFPSVRTVWGGRLFRVQRVLGVQNLGLLFCRVNLLYVICKHKNTNRKTI